MAKTGRNESCPCGSGKKYKKCCLSSPAPSFESTRESLDNQHARNQSDKTRGKRQGNSRALAGDSEINTAESARIFNKLRENLNNLDDTMNELEEYRGEFKKLTLDESEYMKRMESLFTEACFDSMRISEVELERSFKKFGYPDTIDLKGAEKTQYIWKSIDFLFNQSLRLKIAADIICLIPHYCNNKRYMDAWIIQQNLFFLTEPSGKTCGSLLFFLFMEAMRKWDEKCGKEEMEILSQIGISKEQIMQGGLEAVGSMIENLDDEHKDKVECLLKTNPQIRDRTKEFLVQSERAASSLVENGGADMLLLNDNEITPFFPMIDREFADICAQKDFAEKIQNPSKDYAEKLFPIFFKCAQLMAEKIFTKQRLQKLCGDIGRLRQLAEQEGRNETMAINGLSVAATSPLPPTKNLILIKICIISLKKFSERNFPAS